MCLETNSSRWHSRHSFSPTEYSRPQSKSSHLFIIRAHSKLFAGRSRGTNGPSQSTRLNRQVRATQTFRRPIDRGLRRLFAPLNDHKPLGSRRGGGGRPEEDPNPTLAGKSQLRSAPRYKKSLEIVEATNFVPDASPFSGINYKRAVKNSRLAEHVELAARPVITIPCDKRTSKQKLATVAAGSRPRTALPFTTAHSAREKTR